MQFFRLFRKAERKAWIGFIIVVALMLSSISNMVFAGNMGWVYEDNELRASYAGQTWWMVGETVRLSTFIVNMEEDKIYIVSIA